uniref:DUF1257 domain-containing protein n=1 Tax=Candidatus Electrothrix sp. TaxID=2170559 RepID=UPI004056F6D5
MSHLTYMKTRFQNFFYLEKALQKLNFKYDKQQSNSDFLQTNLIIPQSNGYDIEFSWNGEEYELVVDLSFWNQPYPIQSFIDKIAQNYANESVIGESQKIGFQVCNAQKNTDGSQTLVLERWNSNF